MVRREEAKWVLEYLRGYVHTNTPPRFMAYVAMKRKKTGGTKTQRTLGKMKQKKIYAPSNNQPKWNWKTEDPKKQTSSRNRSPKMCFQRN